MTILSDHPILREDEEKARREPDSFALHSRLGAVYDIIRHRNTRAPLAIAVYGDWGTGKSSAMRWLSRARSSDAVLAGWIAR
jgi:predicted KAP-like P-loop ATPase